MAVAATLILVYALACWNARSAMNGLVLHCGRAPAPREFDRSNLEIVEETLDF